MHSENQHRFRYLRFVLGMGLISAGCNSPADVKTSQSPTQADAASSSVELIVPETSVEGSSTEPKTIQSFYTVDQYGEDRNVEDDLKMTMARAAKEKKRILLQVGGDWCGWCKLLTAFVEKSEPVRLSLDRNYLLMKVTYTQKQTNEAFLSAYPKIKGYPHLFVLDADGQLLHSQETDLLEEGKGYNEGKVLAFLENWKPTKD